MLQRFTKKVSKCHHLKVDGKQQFVSKLQDWKMSRAFSNPSGGNIEMNFIDYIQHDKEMSELVFNKCLIPATQTVDGDSQSNKVLMKVKATALNRADLLQKRGKYDPPEGESTILGLESVG